MEIVLKAIRKDECNVDVSLSLNGINKEFSFVNSKVIKITDNSKDIYAVVFHIKNDGGFYVENGKYSFNQTKTCQIPNKIKDKIRVFYWNDNVSDSLNDVLNCFEGAFREFKLGGEVLQIGSFELEKYCPGIVEPRQGGNGGVVGIESPTP